MKILKNKKNPAQGDSHASEYRRGGEVRERLLGRVSLRNRAETCVGLEIGAHCIRAAEGEWRDGQFRLLRVFETCVPGEWDADSARAHLLNAVSSGLGLQGRRVTMLLSGESVRAKVLSMNRLPRAEVRDAVELALRKAFPEMGESEQVVEFDYLGDGRKQDVRFLGVCVPRSEPADLTRALIKSRVADPRLGVDLAAIETLVSADRSLCSDRPTVVLEFGNDVSILSIFVRGKFEDRFVIKVGRRELVEALDEAVTLADGGKYQMTPVEAATFFSRFSLHENETMTGADGTEVDTERIHALTRPVLERLIRDVAKWIRHYQVESMSPSPQGLVLCGEGARILGLDGYLEKYLSLGVQTFDPRSSIHVSKEVDAAAPGESLAVFATAIGGAMEGAQRFNLIPREQIVEAYVGVARRTLRYVACLALVLMAIFAMASKRYGGSVPDRLDSAEADLAAFQSPIAMAKTRGQLEVRRAELIRDLIAIEPDDARGSLVLRDLAAKLGEDIRIQELALYYSQGHGDLEARGVARGGDRDRSWRKIESLSTALDDSPQFRDPSFDVENWEGDETEFELTSLVVFPPCRPVESRELETGEEGGSE